MNTKRWIIGTGMSLVAVAFLSACGSSSSKTTRTSDNNTSETAESGTSEGKSSNIPYLKQNHANYSEHGSTQTPAPVKDANTKTINWTISASTEEDAIKLQEHLKFMEDRLLNDQNPRAWDKLFLMEAYMKYNKYYTTSVERSGTNVVVGKNATTACAYEVISAHSDAVQGDFFARGDIMVDYSLKAETILASSACNDVRTSLENYITSRQKRRGH